MSIVPQLIVRDIEAAVVRKLRRKAAAQGVSVEEAHRRLLRAALLGDCDAPGANFADYLSSIPKSDRPDFPRLKDFPRRIKL